ncbi:MAG: TM2 domain-containing protein [Fusobacteriales bacterium]|jgi:TM2 domain-containing membrane protein YozV|nr:TM2 domain-containing protein [Fusobacteriales bacterium]
MGRYDDDFSVFEEKRDRDMERERINRNYGKKPVHKVVYALLAIFLGSLGIHKFYAGKPVQGVLYILFCWTYIPGIIGFIEGIVVLLKNTGPSDIIYL